MLYPKSKAPVKSKEVERAIKNDEGLTFTQKNYAKQQKNLAEKTVGGNFRDVKKNAFAETSGLRQAKKKKKKSKNHVGNFFAKLIQQWRTKIVDMDLIQTIEDNLVALYDIKGFLTHVNKPEAPDSIVSFILDFELFLEQTA